MASAASINSSPKMNNGHQLAAGVQVRQETEGLLFYNRKGPRLYFMPSGELLQDAYFGSGTRLRTWLADNGMGDSTVRHALASALEDLVKKGVLHADASSA